MSQRPTILELLDITENDYNDMVIDHGFAFARVHGITPDVHYWVQWWRCWLECDEVEIDLGQFKRGQIETYITTQLSAITILNPNQ